MRGDRIPSKLLCRQLIRSADPALLARLEVPAGHRSLGIVTTDCDDVSYAALDEATKAAAVEVVYARSMYAGAQNASTALAGEFIGILSGPDPETVRSGLEAAAAYLEEASFRTANDAGDVVLSQWLEQPPHLETAHRNWIVCHFSRELKEWLQKSTAQL